MITHIRIERAEYLNPDGQSVRKADQIVAWVSGIPFRKDVTCERDVQLAQRLADDEGIELIDHRYKKAPYHNPALRIALAMQHYEATSELHASWEDCAGCMYDILKGRSND